MNGTDRDAPRTAICAVPAPKRNVAWANTVPK